MCCLHILFIAYLSMQASKGRHILSNMFSSTPLVLTTLVQKPILPMNIMDEGMNAGAHTEDRVRLEVGRYFSTVRKVSLKDQLAHPWRFLRQEGL